MLDKAADARDLRNASRFRQLKADEPVLNAAKFGERLLCAENHILEYPADAGRIRAERRRYAGRQSLLREIQVFENAAARPINIRAVLEYDIDKRDAEERKAAHHLRARHRQQRRRERIGNLILDDLRRLARIVGVDNDLRIGEIGNGIQRRVPDGVDTGNHDQRRCDQDQYRIAR